MRRKKWNQGDTTTPWNAITWFIRQIFVYSQDFSCKHIHHHKSIVQILAWFSRKIKLCWEQAFDLVFLLSFLSNCLPATWWSHMIVHPSLIEAEDLNMWKNWFEIFTPQLNFAKPKLAAIVLMAWHTECQFYNSTISFL